MVLKSSLTGDESELVCDYRRQYPVFPHQSTGDQWFDESQTESYRMLGLHTVEEMLEGYEGTTLDDLCAHVRDVYLGPPPAPAPAPAPEHGAQSGDAAKT